MKQQLFIHLRVYRGNDLNYNADGSVKTENHIVVVPYNTREWTLFMQNLRPNGYVKVDVEKVFDNASLTYLEDIDQYKSEVAKAFMIVNDKPLTSEQKEIAELKAMVEKLSSKQTEEETKTKKPSKNAE